jgi:hypothetical protein
MTHEECKDRLCSFCASYVDFTRRGLTEEYIETETGTICITKAPPELKKEVHAWTDQLAAAMASFDMASFAQESSSECPLANLPEAMLEEFKKCALCKMYMENPDWMTGVKGKTHIMKNGMVVTSTVSDPAKVEAYHAFQVRFHQKIDELKKLSKEEYHGKICSFCQKFAELDEAGAIMEWTPTPTGTLTMVVGTTPDLVGKIHDVGKEIMAFEQM